MNIEKQNQNFFPGVIRAQRKLDATIFENKGIGSYGEIFPFLERALKDEIAEFSSALKLAKYWSVKKPDRNHVIEEYVDILHFLASIIIGCGTLEKTSKTYEKTIDELYNFSESPGILSDKEENEIHPLPDFSEGDTRMQLCDRLSEFEDKTAEIFVEYDKCGTDGHFYDLTRDAFLLFMDIGTACGFAPVEIRLNYYKKNQENHNRAITNY